MENKLLEPFKYNVEIELDKLIEFGLEDFNKFMTHNYGSPYILNDPYDDPVKHAYIIELKYGTIFLNFRNQMDAIFVQLKYA